MKSFPFTLYMLGISIVVALGVVGIFGYEYMQIQTVNQNTASVETDLYTEESSLESFRQLAKTASNIKGDSDKANTFFIKREEVVNFLDVIEGVASSTGATVTVESVNDKKDKDQAFVTVDIKIEGSYKNVYHTIRVLEQLPYQSEIESVDMGLSGGTSKTNIPQWSADVNLIGVIL